MRYAIMCDVVAKLWNFMFTRDQRLLWRDENSRSSN